MKALIVPIILLASIAAIPFALADNNSNTNNNANSNTMTSTQSTSMNGQGSTTTMTQNNGDKPHIHTHIIHGAGNPDDIVHFCDGFPFCHPHEQHVIVVHRTIVNHETHFSTPQNQNIPIVFIKGVGFVAPINCKLNSNGDKIVCDFEQVQIN